VDRGRDAPTGSGNDASGPEKDDAPGPEKNDASEPEKSGRRLRNGILFGGLALVVLAGVVVALVLTLGGGGSSDWTTETRWTLTADRAFLHICTGDGSPYNECFCKLSLMRTIWSSPAEEYHRTHTLKAKFLARSELPYCVSRFP
jgi:hypothetical protein